LNYGASFWEYKSNEKLMIFRGRPGFYKSSPNSTFVIFFSLNGFFPGIKRFEKSNKDFW